MKAQRRPDLEKRLAASEEALLARLRFLLPDSATPGSWLFRLPSHSPGVDRIHFVPPASVDLCGIASDCLWLRRRLALPFEGTIAKTLLEACSGQPGADAAQRMLASLLLGRSPLAQSQSIPSPDRVP